MRGEEKLKRWLRSGHQNTATAGIVWQVFKNEQSDILIEDVLGSGGVLRESGNDVALRRTGESLD